MQEALRAYYSRPIQFAYRGRGPNEYDCYGLVRALWRDIYDVTLPDFTSPSDAPKIMAMMTLQLQLWQSTTDAPGVLVALRLPNHSGHVGLSLGDGRFVHIWEKSGGLRLEHLSQWRRAIQGFYVYEQHTAHH